MPVDAPTRPGSLRSTQNELVSTVWRAGLFALAGLAVLLSVGCGSSSGAPSTTAGGLPEIKVTGITGNSLTFELRNETTTSFSYWSHGIFDSPFAATQTYKDGQWLGDREGDHSAFWRCSVGMPERHVLAPGQSIHGAASLVGARFPVRISLVLIPVEGGAGTTVQVTSAAFS